MSGVRVPPPASQRRAKYIALAVDEQAFWPGGGKESGKGLRLRSRSETPSGARRTLVRRQPMQRKLKRIEVDPDTSAMRAAKWLVAILLGYGLFTGIAYVLVPVVTDGWGNTTTLLIGLALLVVCGAGLLRLDPRR